MVFPKALPFARLTFGKSITHGYAQSVVAATQTSSFQQNPFSHFNNRFSAFHNHAHNSLSAPTSHGKPGKPDSGLADYYQAWQKNQGIGARDWQQFQFAKRIEWQPQTLAAESKAQEDLDAEESLVAEEQAIAEESQANHETGETSVKAAPVEEVDEALVQLDAALSEVARQQQVAENGVEEKEIDNLEIVANAPTTVEYTSPEASSFIQQLSRLAAGKHYAEIPAVFEAMLNAGVTPTTSAYHALLAAAIHLPKGKHEAVPKALNVYYDMLHRRVVPDVQTYTVLLELLSARVLSVLSMQNVFDEKRTRYGGLEEEGKFLFKSNETEANILVEDNSLDVATRLFDTAVSIHAHGNFSERTYRLLISACAEQGRIEDMVRIYGHMEDQGVTPRADMFVPMIHAFAAAGQMSNAEESYGEYKALAIAHDNGELAVVRKDHDVYAALIKAYTIAGNEDGATRFSSKLEASLPHEQNLLLKDTVGLKALLPAWLKQGSFEKAFRLVGERLSPRARDVGYAAVCIRAADRNNVEIATRAFGQLSEKADICEPALAMNAMHIRDANLEAAEQFWTMIEASNVNAQFIESTTMYSIALIGSGQAELGLQRARSMFARIREAHGSQTEVVEQIDEAIEVVAQFVGSRAIVLPAVTAMELISAMVENNGVVPSVAGYLLAGFGPEDITRLGAQELQILMQAQASTVFNGSQFDIAHGARFTHILELLIASRAEPNTQTLSAIEKALLKLDQPELTARWQSRMYQQQQLYSPALFSPFPQTPVFPQPATLQPVAEDSYDPYTTTTDNKGSAVITDLLEKTHGRFANHLNDALTRFKNMRRAGRHPRFFTYAKLINAAAKESRLPLAHEILALARQDVPYLPQFRIVRYGWVTILDAMVAACLTTGQRRLADQFHQELLSMDAAPSANTFGLYITTLKESHRTFDEASEAVKIFQQAKAEGVEPSSFLYNALIGKLGKARRIDDCLFYFQEMRGLGIRPTSVTYGTIVNALCRVSDEKFAEELFEEMESMPNYKPRPAPYHSMMQFFLTTKRDRAKVLSFYERMCARNIPPTTHTFKLLIDSYATLDPVDMSAAEAVLEQIQSSACQPDAVHYASLIHAKGCVAHDMDGARALFDRVIAERSIRPQPCLYQALFEAMVANHQVAATEPLLEDMVSRGVELTPYIANSLIHGWAALAQDINKAEAIFARVPESKREPSTYEAMTRAYLVTDMRDRAVGVVNEALARGYPSAVAGKIMDLIGGGKAAAITPPSTAEAESSAGGS
jgi:pentatricopeptide repeat protein